jgi:hypothetical protein
MLLALLLTVTPDVTAQTFLADLRDARAGQVGAVLGAKMKAAISADALIGAWKQASGDLGAFVSLTQTQTAEQGGLTVFIHTAKFEKGALQLTTAVDPTKSTIEGFFIKPLDLAPRTPAPKASYVTPDAYGSFEVKVGAAPFELGGTLTIPKGKGPFPAVVLVHGSGPQDRDETIRANAVFKDLAEGLSSKGVVVLRYDKRTLTYGKQYVGKDISFDEEVIDDAKAGVELLRARAEVKHVYVVGHSLGALLAPAIAAKARGLVTGVVMLAPSSRKPWDILSQQTKYLGAPPEKVAELEAAFDELRLGGKVEGQILNVPASYWRAWADFDGPGIAKTLKLPLLVLHGTRDYQVIDEDIAGWKKGLAGVKNVEFVELPKLNHLFIAGEGAPSPKEYEVPSHVAAEVLERLVKFVK